MDPTPPADSHSSDLDLRDRLAVDRTTLANERTFLGYIRTTLALAAVGASALKFFDSAVVSAVGWVLLVSSVVTLLIGLYRSLRMKRRINGQGGH